MTEVPEHLLKKAAEARAKREAAAGGEPASSEATTATAVIEQEPEEEIIETDEQAEAALARLAEALGDKLLDSHIAPGRGLWIRVPADRWRESVIVARDTLNAFFFDFLSAIDWLPSPYGRELDAEQDDADDREPEEMTWGYAGGATRFQVLCRIHSITAHFGVMIKADLADEDPRCASLIDVFPGANWHEREAMEMFGIGFDGHPDVRNIYLPGGFEGHPLRKDYPLLSRRMKPWPGIVDVELMPGEDS
ncbi:MAG: NADH-quinone oxidoreductase subunit C [Acidimicrobiales bacterium]